MRFKSCHAVSLSHQYNIIIFGQICLLGTTLAVPVSKKPKKRDILPGDPRFGIEQHQHDNDFELSKAIGTHVGSYLVRDNAIPHATYGLPDFTPNNLLSDFQSSAPLQVKKANSQINIFDYVKIFYI